MKTRIRKTSQVRRQEIGRLQLLKQGTFLVYLVRAGDFNKDFKTARSCTIYKNLTVHKAHSSKDWALVLSLTLTNKT